MLGTNNGALDFFVIICIIDQNNEYGGKGTNYSQYV